MVAKDEAGNINYATASSITFEANTPAPGLPLNLEVSDISIKASQDWKLALSWAKPTNQGAGVAQYRIYRSTNLNTGFTQIASTSGQGYFDADLNQVEYYYKVKACDSANNCGAETPVVSKLPTGRFTSPAAIIGSPSAQVSTRKVTVNWVTERESDSKIQYGTESGKYRETEVSNSTQTKSHTLNVEGLEAGTTYYYRVLWTDEDGNTGRSSEMMFTTLPAPVVKNVSVIRKSLNSATIQFTSKDSTAVNILYGRTESFGGLETVNTSASESTYTVELEGLDDGVTYFFRPDAIDTDGFVYGGNIVTFTTPERPRISELRFQPIEGEPTSTQQVTWRTNVPTTSQVTYGLVNTNGVSILDTTPKTEHSLIIKDLQDNSSYFLLAQGRDQDGNLATSDRQTFQTALDSRPPKVLDVTVESSVKGTGGDARGQIVITWKTDEPSTSQVIYGDGGGSGNYNRSTAESSGLKTEHTVVISDLNVSRVYTLRPVSKDGAGNETRGAEQSAIVGRPTDSTLNIILNILTGIFGL